MGFVADLRSFIGSFSRIGVKLAQFESRSVSFVQHLCIYRLREEDLKIRRCCRHLKTRRLANRVQQFIYIVSFCRFVGFAYVL